MKILEAGNGSQDGKPGTVDLLSYQEDKTIEAKQDRIGAVILNSHCPVHLRQWKQYEVLSKACFLHLMPASAALGF